MRKTKTMPKNTVMIIRVQSKNGTKRIEISPTSTVKTLYEKVTSSFELTEDNWSLCKNRDGTGEVQRRGRKSLKDIGLSHGDMIYLKEGAQSSAENEASSEWIFEDEIDVLLSKDDGLIHRNRDPQLCHHGPQGKCLHCSPLEPYDEQYLKTLNPPVKHMSFHAYVKKLKSGASKGKFVSLEDISCRIKSGCKDHPPWPKGICTKCQPSAITLNRQTYRHVDNIMFENSLLVDRFLNYWRTTGCQRIGYLYGRYEGHENVPLGIRATVSAIYEPPQESTRDSIELLPDPHSELIEKLANDFGLQKVGWIFTDLIADNRKNAVVKHLRHMETHFLSAQETIMAADFQNQYPNSCRLAGSGKFGSKFATVVVSGNEEGNIHFDGWQVSNQCMALVRDECLVPTIDVSSLGYVKESSSEQYVPDVFYKEKDDYGNEVTKVARPMPIEYFLIEIPAAFPLQPLFTFPELKDPFPIENRSHLGETQNFDALINHRQKHSNEKLMNAFLDFHFLVYLSTSDMLPLRGCMSTLLEALKKKDEMAFHHWTKSEEWGTVEQLIAAHAPSPPPTGSGSFRVSPSNSTSSVEMMDTDQVDPGWTCKHCTFINKSTGNSCDMCGLPRD